ncbi:MAG: hypothetical protein ACR2PF_00310 [Rhizobiaceae bacterium]
MTSNELAMARRMGLSTAREFKQRKRAEWRAVRKAFDDYRLGCAASPAYGHDIDELERILDHVEEKQSVKQWGN